MKLELIKTESGVILVSDEKPSYGDKILVNGETYNNTICEYRTGSCPPPYVSNPNISKKIIAGHADLPKIKGLDTVITHAGESKTIAEWIGVWDVEKIALDIIKKEGIYGGGYEKGD